MSRTILLDGYNLALSQGTGIATYARNLSFCLRDLGYQVAILHGLRGLPDDPLLRELAYRSEPVGAKRLGWRGKVNRFLASRPKIICPERLTISGRVITKGLADRLPHADAILQSDSLYDIAAFNYHVHRRIQIVDTGIQVDIAHFTYPLPVRVQGAKNICTIHDLVPLLLPDATLGNKTTMLRLFRDLARDLDHVVTVSERSRQDIINLLDVPPEKVTNTWQSVSLPDAASLNEADIRADIEGVYGLSHGNYFLFYGAIEPKKNVARLIDAYAASGVAAPLVIAGKIGWSAERELAAIAAFNATPRPSGARILRLDYVPVEMLTSLISGAKAVLFPSLYEGFGLAVLEAMQLGTPVLTSTEGSLPEIAADAALLVDPYDIRAMAEAIRALNGNADLRADLVAKGLMRARFFSPEAYRERLKALYEQVSGP